MNSINLIGRITADLDLKATTTGKFVTSFTLAVEDGWGENKRTYFIDCVAWQKNAENICQYFSKGSKIAITGKLTTRQYEHQGAKRKAVEVLIDGFTFIDSKKSDSSQDDPFANNSKTVSSGPNGEDLDLPF